MPGMNGIGNNGTQSIALNDAINGTEINSTGSPFWDAAIAAVNNSAEQMITAGVNLIAGETPDHGIFTTTPSTTATTKGAGAGGVGGSGLSVGEVVGIGVGVGAALLILGGALCCYCCGRASHRGDQRSKHEPKTPAAGESRVARGANAADGNIESGRRVNDAHFLNDGRSQNAAAQRSGSANEFQLRSYDNHTFQHDDGQSANHRTSHTSHAYSTSRQVSRSSNYEGRSINSEDGDLRASSLQFEPPARFHHVDESGYRTTGHATGNRRQAK